MTVDLEVLHQRILQWADSCPDLRALLVIGSQARHGRPADEWSDLDLMLFFTDFQPYLTHADWVREIGPVLVCLPHVTGDGDPELLVLYEGGHKVDFVFFTLGDLLEMVQRQALPAEYHPGFTILVDKDGLAARLPSPPGTPPAMEKPDVQEFQRTVETFFYGALYVARQIRRRNLWVVKYRDWTMKEQLLKMLVWHSRAIRGWDQETWHDGHAMADWTDAKTWEALHGAFGRFSAADSWRALLSTMGLFRSLAKEVADQMKFTYPAAVDTQISQLVQNLRAEDPD